MLPRGFARTARALCALVLALAPAAASAAPRFSADPPPDDPAAWQQELRAALGDVLGLDAIPEAGPGTVRVTERTDAEIYVRERVELEVEPGVWAPAYVFLPPHGRPVATIIALHGHGPGKSITAGLTPTAADRLAVRRQQLDLGRQAALRGYAVIAPDQRGFGERRLPEDVAAGLPWSCETLHPRALERGRTLIGERVYDVQQWIAYAATRPEMDADRLAVVGHSAGGTTALFAAAVDPRVQLAVVSGYFGTWQDSIVGLPHCVGNEIPGFADLADLAEVACLVAPRPLLLSLGDADEWMPAAPARRAFDTVEAFYARAGGGPAVLRFGGGGHRVYAGDVWPFVQEHLPAESP